MSFSDDNSGYTIPYPYTSIEYQKFEYELDFINYIAPIIQDQIENLKYLNVVVDLDIYNPHLDSIILNELVYIDNNYLRIHNIDEILDNDIEKRLIFAYLYELFSYDLIQNIIPKILVQFKLQIDDLFIIDILDFKEKLFKVLKNILDSYIEVSNILSNDTITDFEFNKNKIIFYLDLFDTDLTLFRENVLSHILVDYSIEIQCNMIKY